MLKLSHPACNGKMVRACSERRGKAWKKSTNRETQHAPVTLLRAKASVSTDVESACVYTGRCSCSFSDVRFCPVRPEGGVCSAAQLDRTVHLRRGGGLTTQTLLASQKGRVRKRNSTLLTRRSSMWKLPMGGSDTEFDRLGRKHPAVLRSIPFGVPTVHF